MGSGKTTLGKKLASLNSMAFTDLDVFIEQQEQQSIPEIFEREGETTFRKKETLWLTEILKRETPEVIALGGGAVCFNDNLEKLKLRGLLIYLEMPVTALADRLMGAKDTRPLIKGRTTEEITQTIKELLDQRSGYYRQAHLTVNALNLNAKLLQQHILEFTKK